METNTISWRRIVRNHSLRSRLSSIECQSCPDELIDRLMAFFSRVDGFEEIPCEINEEATGSRMIHEETTGSPGGLHEEATGSRLSSG